MSFFEKVSVGFFVISIIVMSLVLEKENRFSLERERLVSLLEKAERQNHFLLEVEKEESEKQELSLSEARISNEIQKKLDLHLNRKAIESFYKKVKKDSKKKFSMKEKVNVSHLDTVPEKVEYILTYFKSQRTYKYNSVPLKQLIEFGRPAIPSLIKGLKVRVRAHFCSRLAAEEALSKILGRRDEELILKIFMETGSLEKVVVQSVFPTGEDAVMHNIKNFRRYNYSYISNRLIDLAFKYNKKLAAQNLLDYIKRGPRSYYAAQKILQETDLDIKAELKIAAKRAQKKNFSRGKLTSLLIREGLPEGLELALGILTDKSGRERNSKDLVLDHLYRYTSAKGSEQEVLEWLGKAHTVLSWDKDQKRFK